MLKKIYLQLKFMQLHKVQFFFARKFADKVANAFQPESTAITCNYSILSHTPITSINQLVISIKM